jgi:CheY-like chemotaxis protein
MPGMDGYDTCAALRREPWGASLPVVALSGWGQAADRQKTREAGFDGHLTKPVDLESLLRLLEDIPVRPAPA